MDQGTDEGFKATVLLVEDEPLIRVDMAEGLRIAGFVVLEAASADDALDYLAIGKRVDIVMTDIQMPGELDGLDLARIVLDQFKDIPVVLTSAYRLSDTLGLPFIPKPYDERDVVDVLRAEINGRNTTNDQRGQRKRSDGG